MTTSPGEIALKIGHREIIQFSETAPHRPFATIEEHDAELVSRRNTVVGPKDMVWRLGNFCFGKRHLEIAAQLNGNKNWSWAITTCTRPRTICGISSGCPEPSMEMRVGNDYGAGAFGSPDETHRAEQGKYGNRDRRRCTPLPDPGILARMYLSNTGYQPTDLDAVLPMLASAEGNGTFAKMLRSK